MADQGEPDGRQRTRGDSKSWGSNDQVDEGKQPTPVAARATASIETVQAASNLLTAKKDFPSNSPASTRPGLAEVSWALGGIAQHLKNAATIPAGFQTPQTSLKLAGGSLPEEIPFEASDGETREIDPSGNVPSSPRSPAISTSNSLGTGVISPPSASQSIESIPSLGTGSNRPVNEPVSQDRVSLSVTHSFLGGGSLASSRSGDNDHPSDSAPSAGSVTESDPLRVGGAAEPATLSVASRVAAVDLPREPAVVKSTSDSGQGAQVRVTEAGSSGSEMRADDQPSSLSARLPSVNLVKNPLSANLRNFSMASASFEEGGGTSSGYGGGGPGLGEDTSATKDFSSGGESLDVTRTNELLQQLVDAVRNQRGSSLPIGGPSVYSDR